MSAESTFPHHKIYLSRRNLLALLKKLDRDAAGEETTCAIIKSRQPSPEFQQTLKEIMVIAVPDEEYYEAQQRAAGIVQRQDEPHQGKTGL